MYYYPLYSGSSGNCSVVESKSTRIMVDAGLSGSTIEAAMRQCKVEPESIKAIVITHEHSDHIKGVGVLSRRYDIPIYANAGTWGIMSGLIGNVREKNIRYFETERDFFIDDINVYPFAIPHDSAEAVGYSFFAEGKKLSVATDIGHVTSRLVGILDKSDLLLIEANHDIEMLKCGSYPYPLKKRILGDYGHLSNDNCGKLLAKLYTCGVNRAILGHLSHENNTEAIAMSSVRLELIEQDIPESSFRIDIAHRDRVCGIFEV